MLRVGLVGLGKMGLSHCAIMNAHPDVRIVAACDQSTYLTEVVTRYAGLKCYESFDQLLAAEQLDAVLISTPSKLHARMVEQALQRDLDVFCEKPFVLDVREGERLVRMAESQGRVTQVGYYYRFISSIQEAARIVRSGGLGDLHHVRVEAYGPVVLRPTGSTWRSSKNEGGGALFDYACHAIDVVNFVAGVPDAVSGVVRHGVFSREVEDEVYCSLHYANGASGQLCVNWSDESFRKMSTKVTVWGTNGRVTADRQECQTYLRAPHAALPETPAGWSVRYTTELSKEVWFYLRGEEYSDQIDYFVQSIKQRRVDGENSFRSALQADRVVSMILAESAPLRSDGGNGPKLTKGSPVAKTLWTKLFG